jgi:putative tryptophan/tyrosine transport system substrate-binding protein
MRRRAFITLFAAAATSSMAWPPALHAQQATIGWIDSGSREQFADRVAGFHRGLAEMGFAPGRNLVIEERWAQGQYERLPAFAAELVQRRITVLAATGAVNSSQAAIRVAGTVPVVSANGGDPVKLGLVASLNRPGGNATGVSFFIGGLGAKRLKMMRVLVPTAKTVGIIANPSNPVTGPEVTDMRAGSRQLGLEAVVFNVSSDPELEAAFAGVAQQQLRALLVNTDSFLSSRRDRIAAWVARQAIPTIYAQGEFTRAGGLMSYGTNLADGYRQAGVYVGRVLKGAKPDELPVLLPTKFETIINLKTAKMLGIEIPPTLLAQADEVIE